MSQGIANVVTQRNKNEDAINVVEERNVDNIGQIPTTNTNNTIETTDANTSSTISVSFWLWVLFYISVGIAMSYAIYHEMTWNIGGIVGKAKGGGREQWFLPYLTVMVHYAVIVMAFSTAVTTAKYFK